MIVLEKLICEIASVSHFQDTGIERHHLVVETVRPSRFSFLTSMRIATQCKRQCSLTPISYTLWTYNIKDALGAISARKLINKSDVLSIRIILNIHQRKDLGQSIPAEVAKNIDAIVFETEQQQFASSSVKNIDLIKVNTVIPLPAGNRMEEPKRNNVTESVLGYILNDGELNTLKKMLAKMSSLDTEKPVKLIVAGTGKARYVMPLVNIARANKLDVEWIGEKYDSEELAGKISGFIPHRFFSYTEKRFMKDGIPPVWPETLELWLDENYRRKASIKAIEDYKYKYDAESFYENLGELASKINEAEMFHVEP